MNIEAKHVTRRFGETEALRDVSFAVAPDAGVLTLIGPSGGGKSTLLRLIGGLDIPTGGAVFVDGAELSHHEESLREYRTRNGFLFQAFNLFPHLTALENVALPLSKVHGQPDPEARETALRSLERFRLVDHATKRPAELSGGQQQRVALARAIAHEPRLLILDEPTSALDPEMTAEVLEMIEELGRGGQRIVLSTHEMGFARAVSGEVIFLAEGRIIEQGRPEEIFENSGHETVKRFLGRVMRY